MAPITQWRIYFPGPDANGYFVDMRTGALSAVAYKYGTYIHNADNTQGRRERSNSVASEFIQVGTTVANVTTYTDNTVFRKKTHYYRVRANGGRSPVTQRC